MRALKRQGWEVTEVSKARGVTRSAYYKRQERKHTRHVRAAVVLKLVETVREDEPRVGTRKLYHRLEPAFKRARIAIGWDKLFDVLRDADKLVKPKKSFQKTTYSKHAYAVVYARAA